MSLNELEQFFKISQSSIETSKLAIETISGLHILYCELFRNEIDNIWHKHDGRAKMCAEFAKATEQFRTVLALEIKIQKGKKHSTDISGCEELK